MSSAWAASSAPSSPANRPTSAAAMLKCGARRSAGTWGRRWPGWRAAGLTRTWWRWRRPAWRRRRGGRPRDGGAVSEAVTAYQGAVRERLRQAELGRARAEVRAEEERKRRRLTAGLAMAGLALLAGLAAGGLWLLQQWAVQRRDVEALVAQAVRLRRAGHFEECQELLG